MTTDTTDNTYTRMPAYTYYDWPSLRPSDFASPTNSTNRFLSMMTAFQLRGSDYILPSHDNTTFILYEGTNRHPSLLPFNSDPFTQRPDFLDRNFLAYLDMACTLRTQLCIRIYGHVDQPLLAGNVQTYDVFNDRYRTYTTNAADWFNTLTAPTQNIPAPDPEGFNHLYFYVRYAITNDDWPTYQTSAIISCKTPPPFHLHKHIDSFDVHRNYVGTSHSTNCTRSSDKLTILQLLPYDPIETAHALSVDLTTTRDTLRKLSRLNACHLALNNDHLVLNNIVEKSAACTYPTALAHAIRNQCTPGTADMINRYGPEHGTKIYELLSDAGYPDLEDITLGNSCSYCCEDEGCGDCNHCMAVQRVNDLEEIIADARRELDNA